MLREAGASEVHLRISRAADPPSLPLRSRHVDPRGDDRPRPDDRGDRRRARRRLARLPLDGGRLRGDRQAPPTTTATPASPAATRSATRRTRTGSSRSRIACRGHVAFRIVVLASGTGTNLQAILDTRPWPRRHRGRRGRLGQRPDARALERAAAAGVETAVFPGAEHRRPRGPRRGDGGLDRGPRRRPRRPRRLHAAAQRALRRPLPQPHRQHPPGAAPRLPRPRRDRPGACGGGRGDRRHRPLRRRGRRHRAGHRPARGRGAGRSRPRAARGGDPRRRARALPGGDPHDRAGRG